MLIKDLPVQWSPYIQTLVRRSKSVRKSRGVRKTEFRKKCCSEIRGVVKTELTTLRGPTWIEGSTFRVIFLNRESKFFENKHGLIL